MQLTKATVICAAIALNACSSDGSSDALVSDEATTGTGSITISSELGPQVDPLPAVNSSSTDGSTVRPESTEALIDTGGSTTGGVASDASGTTDGGGIGSAIPSAADAGSTDAGSGDAGSADGGFSDDGIDSSTSDLATETSGLVSADASGPETVIIVPFEPYPGFQAGSLTAADYDDQLNPHLYQDYASEYLQRVGPRLDLPYLDLSKRIGLHVTDQQGRRYGGSRIDISGAIGQILSLEVPASGITYLYSDIDQLPEQITVRATGVYGAAIDKQIDLAQVVSGRIDIVIPEDSPTPADAQQGRGLDIMFVIDTTGSMGDELNYLKTELDSIINALSSNNFTAAPNIGLTVYRDIGDEYVVRAHGFNNDLASVQRTLNSETFGGGGDYPEAMDQAMHQAIDANWQQDSHKVLFLIADAPPHDDKMRATWQAAEQAREKNIHIVPVAASGVAEDAEFLMRSIAAYTNSRYVFLTDDSGFGNPHAEPDVDCYAVTQLNNLMIRVLNSLISGIRQEPTDNEIIRKVGNYDEGVCLPMLNVQ